MFKYIVFLLILIAVLVGIYQLLPVQTAAAPEEAAPAEDQSHAASMTGGPSVWTFEDASEEDGIPQTRVTVDIHGESVPVGIFQGNCGDMRGSAWELAPGAAEGALCWFAGGGTEIAVFHEGGKHVIKAAPVEEGTAEGGGGRGEFAPLLTI